MPNADRPLRFVIFATAKSGTEWLSKLIGSHPEICCSESQAWGFPSLPETRKFAPQSTLEQFSHALAPRLLKPLGEDAFKPGRDQLTFALLDAIATTMLELSGTSIYGEKFTASMYTADRAVEMLSKYDPHLRFIHLTRDGRDVAVSAMNHRSLAHEKDPTNARDRLDREAHARGELSDPFVVNNAVSWRDTVLAGRRARDVFPNWTEIRYEDLLLDTSAELSRLLAFIGAQATNDDIATWVQAASFQAASGRERGEEDRASTVRKGVSGDWVNWFTTQQAEMYETIARSALAELGYAKAT